MELFTYASYDHYRRIQTETNAQKIANVWANKDDIRLLADYLKTHLRFLKFGICHGTRRGAEQAWFREFLDIDVVGTEISSTANQFKHTIQWDFHEAKPEWLCAVDFIYSNSLDHSYKPRECLATWLACLRPSGACIIEWTKMHVAAGPTEPFGASFEEHRALVPDGYAIRDTVSSISTVCGEHRKHLIITQAGCAFNLPPAQSAPSVPEALALGAAPAAPPSPFPSEPAQCGPPPGKTFLH